MSLRCEAAQYRERRMWLVWLYQLIEQATPWTPTSEFHLSWMESYSQSEAEVDLAIACFCSLGLIEARSNFEELRTKPDLRREILRLLCKCVRAGSDL